jgi:Na+/melibiose symporter-like transporter
MIASFFGGLILSFMLAHLVVWIGAGSCGFGAFIGFVCWLGFVAVPLCCETLYERRSFKLFAINSGYWLAALLISGGLLAVWR